MRLFILIPMLAAALQADPITVVETRSSVGLISLFDSYSVPDSSGAVTAQINGYAQCYNIPSCGDQPATGAIDLTMNLYTQGPIRAGIALVQLSISKGGAPEGNGQVSGAIGPYVLTDCAEEITCNISGFLPVELGVPFTIQLSGLANAPPPRGGAGFVASASLSLFELPIQAGDRSGAPVQIFVIPEPGSAALAFTGLAGLMLFAGRRRRTLSKTR